MPVSFHPAYQSLNTYYYAVMGVVTLTALAVVARFPMRRGWIAGVAVVGLAFFVGYGVVMARDVAPYCDFTNFWDVGTDVLSGRDPIDRVRNLSMPPLNPPTAYPMFALLALLPYAKSFAVWTLINVFLCLTLVPLFRKVLWRSSGGLRPELLALFAAFLALSNATRAGLSAGQLAIFTASAIAAALIARESGRPVLAGLCLSAATVKVNTLFPFLLLFGRRSDLKTWVTLALVSLALCLGSGKAAELPGRLVAWAGSIKRVGDEGGPNDFSFAVRDNSDVIGFDHAVYRLGLHDRTAVRLVQLASVALLGAWLGREVLMRDRLSRAEAVALVSLYSMLFLYHRSTDTIILGLPLLYTAWRATTATGRARLWFTASAVATVAVLLLQRKLLYQAQVFSFGHGTLGRVVQAVVLPYAVWSLLIALACLRLGLRASGLRAAKTVSLDLSPLDRE
jgi:hypothetical protein